MRLAILALFLLSVLGACEGGTGESTVCHCLFDGGAGADSGISEGCNIATQFGCQDGEKCAKLVESDDPYLHRASCVPDGTVSVGQACARGAAGPQTGYDDCAAGLDCFDGV